MFLLLNDGKTQREIAEFIGCSLKTVDPWCVHGDPNNLESLEDGRKNGNHKKAPEEYINLLNGYGILTIISPLEVTIDEANDN